MFASGYLGRDIFGAGFVFNWGNTTGTVRWNHIFNSKLFMNLTAFYSNYKYELGFKNEGNAQKFEWKSNIINYSFKPDFTYYLNNRKTPLNLERRLSYTLLNQERQSLLPKMAISQTSV